MAEERLTITDLRKIISKQMSLPEETASSFLAALFPAILDGLKQDQQVRISGLGAFKLVRIAPRKSVNIHSGETIVLDGYNKVTFVPESYIREQINEPFADLEAIRVDENGQPLDPESTLPGIDPRARFEEQADEIKDILKELNLEDEIAAKPEIPEMPQEVEEPEEAEKPQETEEPEEVKEPEKLQETKEKSTPKKPKTREQKPFQDSHEEPVVPAEPKKQPKFRGWIVALVTIFVLLTLLVAGYFVLVNKLEDWANKLGQQQEEEEIMEQMEEVEMLDMEPLLPIDSTVTDSVAATETAVPEEVQITFSYRFP